MKRIKILTILSILLLTGCTLFKRDNMENINIITTIYPLEYSIDYLYGESSIVSSIYPDDINTSEYTLTDKQIKDNSKKDLFVYEVSSLSEKDLTIFLKIKKPTQNTETEGAYIVESAGGLYYINGHSAKAPRRPSPKSYIIFIVPSRRYLS